MTHTLDHDPACKISSAMIMAAVALALMARFADSARAGGSQPRSR
jgi:hypothetical protein